MTVVDKPSVAVVTPAMVRAVIDSAVERRYTSHDGALGIRGRLAAAEHTIDHAGTTVRAVNCRSALAVREQLLTRDPDRWLVVVTERGEDDLGAGVLAHLVGQRLRTPDPWQAVRQRFGDRVVTGVAARSALSLRTRSLLPGPLARRVPVGGDLAQLPTHVGALPVVDAAVVRAAHALGVEVHVWTVDRASEMHRLLDLGVDGLMTDRPDVLRDVLVVRDEWDGPSPRV